MKKMMIGLLALSSLLMCSCKNKEVEALCKEVRDINDMIVYCTERVDYWGSQCDSVHQVIEERHRAMSKAKENRKWKYDNTVPLELTMKYEIYLSEVEKFEKRIEELKEERSEKIALIEEKTRFFDRKVDIEKLCADNGNAESSN